MRPFGIYVHIPFCIKKCLYCDFNSLVPKNTHQVQTYVDALCKETSITLAKARGRILKTIYIGGGTPSVLKQQAIQRILDVIKLHADVNDVEEITIEANPESLTLNKLKSYKTIGINRISMGVQSFNNKNLKFLGRAHTVNDVYKAIDKIKQCGFAKISIDLIYGLPGQTVKDWEKDIREFLKTGICHISFYDLKIEKGAYFYRSKDKLAIADNDLQAKMYKRGINLLEKAGFRHYEISSFALKGQEALHNQLYWRNKEYIGLGAGAYSYLNGIRFCKARNLSVYQKQAVSGSLRKYELEKLSPKERLKETIVLNLRLIKGFCLEKLENGIKIKADRKLKEKLDELVGQNLLLHSKGNYRLSKKGILYYDSVASELL